MDQELKQRLIGAAVITALAAIFVPMLFDDPIDESGKSINELKIPELPSKAQDVEIMPLPERVEDVATVPPLEKPQSPTVLYEGEEDGDGRRAVTAPPPAAVITEQEAFVSARPKRVEPDFAEEEDVPPPPPPSAKPIMPRVESVKPSAPAAVEPAAKSSTPVANATVRWYLNAGSFSQKANAMAMLESLRKQGFATSIKEVASEKGSIYKVRVGPLLDRAKAQEVKEKLAKIHVNSFVSGEE